MFTKDTGSVNRVGNEVAQESGADVTTEAAVTEVVVGTQMPGPGPSVQTTADVADAISTPDPTTDLASVDVSGGDSTSIATKEDPEKNAATYSQEYVDQLKDKYERDRQFSDNRLRDVETELKDRKSELEDANRRHQLFGDAVKSIYLQLGDATPAKLYAIVLEMAQLKQQADNVKDMKKELENLKTVEKKFSDLNEENCALKTAHRELEVTYKQLQNDYQSEEATKEECQQQLKSWEAVGSRMIAAFAPLCLKERDWFLALLSELQEEVYKDPPSDAAILLFASLAELAVMERSSASPCFEWKKQLADIGLVVANYMHQKKSAEGDVLKVLRNFSQALQEMPILKKLKIGIRIPSLGGDFNTDEVKHKNNGSVVAKVLNWCIVEDGHVYCKAVVE